MNWFLTTPYPLAAASVVYLLSAEAYRRQGHYGLCATFIFYALANVGLMAAFYE